MAVPAKPKIYHIVHSDRLASIVNDGHLWSDAEMAVRHAKGAGTNVGMTHIKARRLANKLASHRGLTVGQCVPFYFCPRSVMLYLLHKGNHPDVAYRGGQGSIVHLEFDVHVAVKWAERHAKRWAFTLSNAGAHYFEDRCDLSDLGQINWGAVAATQWSASDIKEGKQAEFLVEERFPWSLVERVGISTKALAGTVSSAIANGVHHPSIEVRPDWYY